MRDNATEFRVADVTGEAEFGLDLDVPEIPEPQLGLLRRGPQPPVRGLMRTEPPPVRSSRWAVTDLTIHAVLVAEIGSELLGRECLSMAGEAA
jgi:hypothetical protein